VCGDSRASHPGTHEFAFWTWSVRDAAREEAEIVSLSCI
jgi:hypothetical protein